CDRVGVGHAGQVGVGVIVVGGLVAQPVAYGVQAAGVVVAAAHHAGAVGVGQRGQLALQVVAVPQRVARPGRRLGQPVQGVEGVGRPPTAVVQVLALAVGVGVGRGHIGANAVAVADSG